MFPTIRSYASYNYSAPRLPGGLAFSSTLRAITNQAFDADGVFTVVDSKGVLTTEYWNLGRAKYSGLSCPYLLPAGAVDDPSNFLEWLLDPEYTLFQGCQCALVSFVRHCIIVSLDALTLTCLAPDRPLTSDPHHGFHNPFRA